jgi:ATP adenylyltransferase
MQYIQSARRESGRGRCLFCRLRDARGDARHWILRRTPRAFLVLNAFPYTSGHVMVAVARHAARLADLTAAERQDVWELASLAERALERAYRPDGMNFGANLGLASGAGVEGHLHLHLVPRWLGDTNFMTAVGDAKVLPEALPDTYRRLCEALQQVGRRGARRAGERRKRAPGKA